MQEGVGERLRVIAASRRNYQTAAMLQRTAAIDRSESATKEGDGYSFGRRRDGRAAPKCQCLNERTFIIMFGFMLIIKTLSLR